MDMTEAPAPAPSPAPEPGPEVVELAPTPTAVIAGVVAMAELPAFFDQAFSTLPGVLADQGVAITGAAFARYHGMPSETVDLEVGFPTAGPIAASGDVRPGTLPGGSVARLVHHGSFDGLGGSWARLGGWIATEGHTPGSDIWEVYVTEPSPDMDPADLRTELNWPLA
jgi:effector-binding domain-containing protein